MTRFLHIIKPYGDPDAGDQQVCLETETSRAAQEFAQAMLNGSVAYEQMTESDKPVVTREFHPEAHRITIRPPMAGG